MGKLFKEIKKYGIREVYYHLAYVYSKSHFDKVKAYSKLSKAREKYLSGLSDEQYRVELCQEFEKITGLKLNLDNPVSYSEKIQWLKCFDDTEVKSRLADKFAVREWIEEKIGERYLVPLLGVWDSPQDIPFCDLPQQFCLKANHGSGMNIVVKDKNKLDINKAIEEMQFWMDTPFGTVTLLEKQYLRMPRKIIAEQYIEQTDGNLLDYKIHCFAGIPKIIQVIGDRNQKLHKAKEAFFDTNWKRCDLMYNTYDQYEIEPKKPKQFEEMLKIARVLSSEFKYVRVDLYVVKHRVMFGEMTFTPAGGYGKWKNKEAEKLVGSWIKI